jgi:hypothetical protein
MVLNMFDALLFSGATSSEAFAANLDINELPAHRFLQSIYNITIERGWLRLRLQWGDNVKVYWDIGIGVYNPSNPDQ